MSDKHSPPDSHPDDAPRKGCCKGSNHADEPVSQGGDCGRHGQEHGHAGGCCGKGHDHEAGEGCGKGRGHHGGHGHGRGKCGGHGHHGHHGGHSHHGHHHGGDQPHFFAPEFREVDESWFPIITDLLDPSGKDVIDLGCGAGVYARGWLKLGAATVTGVDHSEESINAARDQAEEGDGSTFVVGDIDRTELPAHSADIVFLRAVYHHVEDLDTFFGEVKRLLRPGGTLVIQDWTVDNLQTPGSNTFPHGHHLTALPDLYAMRAEIAVDGQALIGALEAEGFEQVHSRAVQEVKRTFPTAEAYIHSMEVDGELGFLRHCEEEDLQALFTELRKVLDPGEVVDTGHWTIWTAQLPSA